MDPTKILAEPTDVNVKVGCKVFPCHRRILITHSKHFEILFEGSFKDANDNTISLPSEYVHEESFSKLVNAMYGKPLVIEDDLQSLIIASSYLHLTSLMDECKDHIVRNFKTINVPKLLALPQLREYSSLYATLMKYTCRHFAELHSKMIRIPFDLFEELFKHEELLLFSRNYALKFSKLWLSHYRRDRNNYRKRVSQLLLPFRNYRKATVVNQCKRYIEDNFDAKDMVELFLTFNLDENHPLYVVVKEYICQNFNEVPLDKLGKLSFPVLKDLLSDRKLFDMTKCAESVLDFGLTWINCEKEREAYEQRVHHLLKPFSIHLVFDIEYDFEPLCDDCDRCNDWYDDFTDDSYDSYENGHGFDD